MINICIDGNYVFHKILGSILSVNKYSKDFLSIEEDRNIFMQKIIADLSYSLNQIPNLNKVVFCIDSKSWRKNFKISRGVYKENRKYDERVNWEIFFNLMDEFEGFLEENGFIFSKVTGAEADDLLWAWSDYFKNKEDSIIIISGDKDIYQLVSYSENKWINVWTNNLKNNKFIVDLNWKIEEETEEKELSVFDVNPMLDLNNSKLIRLISSCAVEKINPKEFIFKKVLFGDRRDNIPGVFPHKTKNGKDINIGESKAQKIWDFYFQSPWEKYSLEEIWDSEDFFEWISEVSLKVLNQSENRENKEKFKQYYKENIKLLWLNKKTIPEDLIKNIYSHIEEKENKQKPKLIINKNQLIEKSNWGDSKTILKEFDPFNLY